MDSGHPYDMSGKTCGRPNMTCLQIPWCLMGKSHCEVCNESVWIKKNYRSWTWLYFPISHLWKCFLLNGTMIFLFLLIYPKKNPLKCIFKNQTIVGAHLICFLFFFLVFSLMGILSRKQRDNWYRAYGSIEGLWVFQSYHLLKMVIEITTVCDLFIII